MARKEDYVFKCHSNKSSMFSAVGLSFGVSMAATNTQDKELSRGEDLCQLLMNAEITRRVYSAYLDNIVFRIIRACFFKLRF